MADQLELARMTADGTLAVDARGGPWRDLRICVERSAFAAALSYVGFVILLFVLLAAVLLAPLLAVAFPLACLAHDARARRASAAS